MTTMTDDQLDAMLGRFLRAEAEEVGIRARGDAPALEALQRRIARTPTRRSWILLVAALLVTSAAAIGLSVGAANLPQQAETSPAPVDQHVTIQVGGECGMGHDGLGDGRPRERIACHR